MKNETKVFIEENYDHYKTKVWVRNYRGNVIENLMLNDGVLESEIIEFGKCHVGLKPFIELPTNYFNDIFPVIMQSLQGKGFKTEYEYVNEGKLNQMIEHKNDLKDILKSVIEKIPTAK